MHPADPAPLSIPPRHAAAPRHPLLSGAAKQARLLSIYYCLSIWVLLSAINLRAQPVDLPAWLKAIETLDRSILQPGAKPPAGLPAALGPKLPAMSSQARVLAARTLAKVDSPDSAVLLLVLAQDPDSAVAAAAVNGLLAIPASPPPADVLRAIPATPSPPLRAHLFLIAGKANAELSALRKLLAAESNPNVRPSALAATVRLGGVPERAALAAEVANAKGPAVATVLDLLVFANDKRMAFALLPLFGSTQPVKRLTADPVSRVATRSDLAVWTAHRLGLLNQLKLTKLDNFDAATVSKARAACSP